MSQYKEPRISEGGVRSILCISFAYPFKEKKYMNE